MKRQIYLWDLDGAGVVISCPSGVFYTNQTGGYACLQPETQGVFLPLPEHSPGARSPLSQRLQTHFTGAPVHLQTADADFVDAQLRGLGLDFIEVDRARLEDSFEAWVHVRFRRSSDFAVGFEGAGGILTWPNSD